MKVILFLALLLAVAQAKDLAEMDEEAEINDMGEEWDEEDLDEIMNGNYQRKRTIFGCTSVGTVCASREGECQSSSADASKCEKLESGLCYSSSCKCCIDCQKDTTTNCYTNNGKCKKLNNCGMKEYRDDSKTCNSPFYCGCCRKCDTPSNCKNGISPGFCIGNTAKLTEKHYVNTTATCTQSSCTCYNRCVRKRFCSENNGRCIVATNNCKSNETKFSCGCKDSDNCACCIKSNVAANLNADCSR